MKNFKRTWFCMLLGVVLMVAPAYALDTMGLLREGPSKVLLGNKKPIHAKTKGVVPIEFVQAMDVYAQPDLLSRVQEAYCKLLTDSGTPEFSINQSSSNTYFYVNKDMQRTDITEVLRRQTSDDTFDIILYSAGTRFFGDYQAVVHVQLTASGDDTTQYHASVYAYPENAFSRFFARRLGLVRRYFKKKTGHMTEIITTISCSLCEAKATASDSI